MIRITKGAYPLATFSCRRVRLGLSATLRQNDEKLGYPLQPGVRGGYSQTLDGAGFPDVRMNRRNGNEKGAFRQEKVAHYEHLSFMTCHLTIH